MCNVRMVLPFTEHLNINTWKKFSINHSELEGKTVVAHLADNNNTIPRENGIYCYSSFFNNAHVCLRVGISFGQKTGLITRFERHRLDAIKRSDGIERYNIFFSDILCTTEFTVRYKIINNFTKLDLLKIENALIMLYRPVWEFPFEEITTNDCAKLLAFGKMIQENVPMQIGNA